MSETPAGRFAAMEQNFAANLRIHREARGLSQEDLAQAMTERGFGFSQATIWKIEQGKRPVRMSEAQALAEVLGEWTSVSTLLVDPDLAQRDAALRVAHSRAYEAYQALKTAAAAFIRAQESVLFAVSEAQRDGIEVHSMWASWLTMPAERAVLEARAEGEKLEEARMEIGDQVNQLVAALQAQGMATTYEPSDLKPFLPKP